MQFRRKTIDLWVSPSFMSPIEIEYGSRPTSAQRKEDGWSKGLSGVCGHTDFQCRTSSVAILWSWDIHLGDLPATPEKCWDKGGRKMGELWGALLVSPSRWCNQRGEMLKATLTVCLPSSKRMLRMTDKATRRGSSIFRELCWRRLWSMFQDIPLKMVKIKEKIQY